MMKFREFVRKRRGKTVTSKGTEQSVHQGLDSDSQVRTNDTRVLIGIDPSSLPPAAIPPRFGEVG